VDTQSEIELFWDFLLNDADDAAAISSQSTKASFPASALCDPSFKVDKIGNFFLTTFHLKLLKEKKMTNDRF